MTSEWMVTHFVGDDCPGGHRDDPMVPPERSCQPCANCGVACAKTEDDLCWECSTELGEAGA